MKIYCNLYELQIPIMHRQFLENFHKIMNIYDFFAMIDEILFILHVANGVYIIIHNLVWYTYIYSKTCTNKCNYTYSIFFILLLVQLSIISLTFFEDIIIKKNFSRPFQQYIICQNHQKSFH